MNIRSRDWPPPLPPDDEESDPAQRPRVSSVIALSVIIFLVIGSVLAAWFVAVLPGDHPWAPAIVPAGWTLALVAFLIGSFVNWRTNK